MENFVTRIFYRFHDFLRFARGLYKEIKEPSLSAFNMKDFPLLQAGSFLHSNIVQNIAETMKFSFKVKYIFDGTEVDLNILYEDFDESRNNYLLFTVNLMIFILNMYKKNHKKLRLLLVYCPLKKMKPSKEKQLTSENVNTGVTMMNSVEGDVIIYRAEEMTKVLIHELIHFYDFDRKHISSNVEKDLNMYFGLVGKTITVNESFTDTFACLINLCIYTLFKHPLVVHDDKFYKMFLVNFEQEKKFIISQAANVLKYLGYNISQRGKILKSKLNYEQTHVISYYVLKAANFNNIIKFIEYLNKFNYHLNNPIEYVDVLKHNMVILTNILYTYAESKHLNSLKMTSLDVGLFYKVNLLKDKSKR